jgi:hypothetical protein
MDEIPPILGRLAGVIFRAARGRGSVAERAYFDAGWIL